MTTSGLYLSSDVLDGGLSVFALANKISICSTQPTTYTSASTTNALGVSTYAIGSLFGSISTSADGEQISAVAVSSANVNANGAPVCWAALDDANSRLLAYGPMTGSTDVVAGHKWSLSAFTIDMPGFTYTFPLSGASIDLHFQYQRYYSSTATIAITDVLSISRASIGYAKTAAGTLTQFSNDTLRITDLGLLVEDARTNIIIQSQDFSTTWVSVSLTSITGGFTAPDGTSTAQKIIADATSNIHDLTNHSSATAQNYSVSIYAKAGEYNFAYMNVVVNGGTDGSFAINVNLTTGAITDTNTTTAGAGPTIVSQSVETLGNGWFRLNIVVTATAGQLYTQTGPSTSATPSWSSSRPIFTGDASSGIYMWGSQMEAGSFPSSYIPTTTTSATRAADDIRCIGNAKAAWNAATGSLLFNNGSGADYGLQTAYFMKNPTGNRQFRPSSNSDVGLANDAASGVGCTLPTGIWPQAVKAGASWDGSGRSVVANGGTVGSDANLQGASIKDVYFGCADIQTGLFSYVQRATFWSTRLSDATLQALTAP